MELAAIKVGELISIPPGAVAQTTAADYIGYDGLCAPGGKQGMVVNINNTYNTRNPSQLDVNVLTPAGKIAGFVCTKDTLATILEGEPRNALMTTITNMLTSKQKALTHAFALSPKPLLGCDPEVFVMDEYDQVIPAWTFLPDKKTAERRMKNVSYYDDPATAFWDGPQAEFAFQHDPPTCLEILTGRVQQGLTKVYNAAKQKNPSAHISLKNLVQLPQATLETADDKMLALGCAPSLNVYDLPPLDVPNPRMLQNRSAGWHVHLSNLNCNQYKGAIDPALVPEIIKALDKTIGVLSVAMCEGLESPLRRRYYGWPGEYRLPRHGGIEYRVCGPALFLSHPAIHHLAWEIIRRTIKAVQFGVFDKLWHADTDEVIETILTLNVEKARRMFEENLDAFKMLLATYEDFGSSYIIAQAVRVVREGIAKVVTDPHNVTKNWNLTRSEFSYTNNVINIWTFRNAAAALSKTSSLL